MIYSGIVKMTGIYGNHEFEGLEMKSMLSLGIDYLKRSKVDTPLQFRGTVDDLPRVSKIYAVYYGVGDGRIVGINSSSAKNIHTYSYTSCGSQV